MSKFDTLAPHIPKNHSYENGSARMFITHAQPIVDARAREEHSPGVPGVRLQLAHLIGLDEYIVRAQHARLSEAVGKIATNFDPTKHDSTDRGSSKIRVSHLHDGTPLFDLHLPDVTVETLPTNGSKNTETRVGLQYLDPKRRGPVGMPSPHAAVDLTSFDTGPFEYSPFGVSVLNRNTREPLVTSIEAVSAMLCEPEFAAQAAVNMVEL